MESAADHADTLAATERAAAAPYVDYPATPSWYAPAVGTWAAALVAALTLLVDHPVLRVVSLLSLVAAECAFLAWYRSYRGTMPSLRRAPTEINREFRWYLLGVALVVAAVAAAVAAAALWVSGILATLLAFVLVTAGAQAYERRYARAAAATRARLG